MTALWTSNEIANATSGECVGSWDVSGVSIDSRTVKPGDLFVALKGPTFDGHDYVAAALKAGAAGALVHFVPGGNGKPDFDSSHDRLVMVKDTFAALENLARAARARTKARIVAVTGSVGKTGTKEALKHALGVQGATHATEGNLNNHWGVPLSLARMPAHTQYGVFELGMNHPGEIAPLSKMVRPHAAIVTSVEPAHLEFFNSVGDIAAEKASIAAGLEPDGAIVLPRDNPQYFRLRATATELGCKNIIDFGMGGDSSARLVSWSLTPDGTQVAAEMDGRRFTYDLGMPGRHWALNSIAALSAVKAIGADVFLAAAAMSRVAAPKGRGKRHRVSIPGGSFIVVDESYNASPAAVRAMADMITQMRRGPENRLIIALGDMLELGAAAPDLHADLANSFKACSIDLVFTAGPLSKHLHDALPPKMRGGHADDSAALIPMITSAVRGGDVIAVKGSFGSRMGPVVDALTALDAAAPPRAANGH